MKRILIALLCLGGIPAHAQDLSVGIRSGIASTFYAEFFSDVYLPVWLKSHQMELALRSEGYGRLSIETGIGYYRMGNIPNHLKISISGPQGVSTGPSAIQLVSVPVSVQMRIGPERRLRFYAGLTSTASWAESVNGKMLMVDEQEYKLVQKRFLWYNGLSQMTTYRFYDQLEAQLVLRAQANWLKESNTPVFLDLYLMSAQLGLSYRF